MTRFWIIPLSLLLLLGGCETIEEKEQANSLHIALRSFETAMRWDRMEHAYGFLEPELLEQHPPPEDLEGLRMLRYEVLEPPVFLKDGRVMQLVQLEYVRATTQVVKKLQDRQYWRFDEEYGKWVRTNPIPAFD